jgi:hypothetical protein
MDGPAEIRMMARMTALEHAVVVLLSQEIFRSAKKAEQTAELHARHLAEGLVSTAVEGRYPEGFREPLLGALRELGDAVIVNGQTFDELGQPDS